MEFTSAWDIIVVGAGHAGIEAALVAARRGLKVAIFTIKLEAIGRMSCNPSIGGPAKGHLAREVDALGGEIGRAADLSGIHYRMLNRSKGPAVWAPRAQNDREAYHRIMREALENQPGLQIIEASINELIISDGKVCGVISQIGHKYYAPAVILATGTFLRGKIHVGKISYPGGRSGEPSADELSLNLGALGLQVMRFKTGTPPRVDMRSLDFSCLEAQAGDEDPQGFSYYRDIALRNQVSCYLTHTTPETSRIIQDNLSESALYSGIITGIGPRYCPSIEDKIVKFPQRDSHHVFIEPEGINTHEAYVNGISTSLPPHIQEQIVHSIPGMEKAVLLRYAYAIEYDYVNPEEIDASLAVKKLPGLYLAGQINGTSGYEEAAAQGIMAGINASLFLEGKDPLILSRSDAYIGVLIDDLVTRGTNEPYRMFTSRAEYRLLLRQDNADERLMPVAHKLGLLSEARWQRFTTMLEVKARETEKLKAQNCTIAGEIKEPVRFAQLLKRPEINFCNLPDYGYNIPEDLSKDIQQRIELEIKYEGYLKRMEEEMQRFRQAEDMNLPEETDYFAIPSVAWEAREKLARIKPRSIGQAMRIPGINYSDSSALMIWLRKNPTGKEHE
ncbi:MAG: tRNA uridine-5-carboxymethylaminomethyl(34) synthesis enzyme MnmG [Candidatus Cloacimonetes bacterium HGW-Cloacimonetes-3]|jgi:tRNA uridine 5-carboxymethylaminomethyl modification enzyme|nr:MAG: tRNA uridine-5-carboxymethylaminomethyl(34) synthesis enzyme MnmG [Candidatus Cloacimonetes bacterium HGW-Cloacimonetes-3]